MNTALGLRLGHPLNAVGARFKFELAIGLLALNARNNFLESIVAEGANAYQRERRLQRGQALLKSFRAQADAVRIQEVERTLKNLEKGDNAEELIQQLSKTLTQKLIHPPTAAIRSASAEGRQDLLTYFGELYDLDPALSEDADQTSPIQDQNINSTDA